MNIVSMGNDERGWIMTALSGLACMLGASIICIDILVRRIPHPSCRDFKIQDSNAFLSSSLSLSFGVMLFSSMYSMLPNAKTSLQKGGYSPRAAAWVLIALFLAGVVGIQILSRVLHHFIPSHVVDCNHTHEDEEVAKPQHYARQPDVKERNRVPSWRGDRGSHTTYGSTSTPQASTSESQSVSDGQNSPLLQRPSFTTRVSELVGTKKLCNEDGQCFGLTAPCGMDCFKIIQARGGSRTSRAHLSLTRSATLPSTGTGEMQPLLRAVDEHAWPDVHSSEMVPNGLSHQDGGHSDHVYGDVIGNASSVKQISRKSSTSSMQSRYHEDHPPDHHHHVPTNAFLSIGLQTCIAIALHKLPEGFITYATNHANPKLGLSVFVALFIHNITEGFAMALPLYLAIKSRPKAMIWAAILGGISQPLGAGVAALWFHLAGSQNEPSEGVYGGMFAIVAGIMSSVALQLFSESLDLTHNRNMCMVFAFIGMGILGMSSALTA